MELVFFPVVTILRMLLFLYHSQVSVATSLLQYLAIHVFVVLFISIIFSVFSCLYIVLSLYGGNKEINQPLFFITLLLTCIMVHNMKHKNRKVTKCFQYSSISVMCGS